MDQAAAEFLRDQQQEILRDWEARVCARVGKERGPGLRDHVPKLLETMNRLAGGGAGHDVPQIGQQHAWVRARQGWDVHEVACELSELRNAIWAVYADETGAKSVPLDLVTIVEDVLARFSERTLTEFVHHQQQSLEESEARLKAIIDYAPSVIYVKEPPEFRYKLVNQAFIDLFGVSREEAIGHTDAELLSEHASPDSEAWQEHDQQVQRTGASLVVEEKLVHEGKLRTFLTVKFPLEVGAEAPSICGISTEITTQKQLEAARERFVGVLGHDLRNPVAAISMTAALLLRRGGLDPDQQRLVRRMADSSERIARLAADLLDVTRWALGGGLQLERQKLDFAAAASLVVDEVRAGNPHRSITFKATGDCTGEWDRGRIDQAVSNLVANAVQHGADPVEVEVEGQEDTVALRVNNRGEPISAELLPRLFEPFTHLAHHKSGRSVGLGLSIVNAVARGHGAVVQVASDEEHGTTFTIRWPRAPRPAIAD